MLGLNVGKKVSRSYAMDGGVAAIPYANRHLHEVKIPWGRELSNGGGREVSEPKSQSCD